MVIQIDSREKPKAIEQILAEFDKEGIQVIRSKLYVGDYMSLDNPRLVIDRKQNLLEVTNNIATDDQRRFREELKKAKQAGIKMVFLIEHGYRIAKLEDVKEWQNPRCKESPMAASGERIYKMMLAYQNNKNDYDIEWRFCTKEETGKRIIEILKGNDDGKEK